MFRWLYEILNSSILFDVSCCAQINHGKGRQLYKNGSFTWKNQMYVIFEMLKLILSLLIEGLSDLFMWTKALLTYLISNIGDLSKH